jgi:PAS domain S-box-containing protein
MTGIMSGFPRPHVLVVDDDADTRELYRIVLESVGYSVEAAASVRAAAALIDLKSPHVVLTDWRLPDGDGYDVAAALRAHHASRRTPLVAVTGVSMSPDMAADVRARGFASIVLKPASPDAVLAAIRSASELATARQLRAAAQRLRRYVQAARQAQSRSESAPVPLDAGTLITRAASRSGSHVALLLADDAAHYVAAAGGACELTGYRPEELLTLSVWDLTPPSNESSGESLWSSFIASGRQEGRYLVRRRDGIPIEAQYCAIANVVPGLHVSAMAAATQMAASL